MFKVVKDKPKRPPVEANQYVEKNKLPDKDTYKLRNKIKEVRSELKLTQANLADMLHITRQSIALIETERQEPSMLMCWKIAKVLNTDITELFYISEGENDDNEAC